MPLLSSIFSRKNKASPRAKQDDKSDSIHSSAAASDLDSALSSPTTSYYAGKSLPAYPHPRDMLHPDSAREHYSSSNVQAPPMPTTPSPTNGSRLRLAFSRKKSNISGVNSNSNVSLETSAQNFNTSPRPPLPSRASTDDPGDRRLRPPPSRSAIFAAYGDPNSALSTRSLPNDPALAASNSHNDPSSRNPQMKRPSLFPWAKQQPTPSESPPGNSESFSTSNMSPSSSTSQTSPDVAQSFNLKSFRHIRPPSPSNGSNVSLAPPVPRPRGESVNSDSSQRISVAAFREAQSRRSLAGSPSPSFRSTSPLPGLSHAGAMSGEESQGNGHSRPSRSHPAMPQATLQQRRRSSMAFAYTSESNSSDSSSDEESGDENAQQRSGGRPSFNAPGRADKTRAKSEIGHGHMPSVPSRSKNTPLPQRAPKSHVGHSVSQSPASRPESTFHTETTRKIPEVPPRSQSSMSHYAGTIRPRASASTSAISPSAAAQRASVLAASNSNINIRATLESRPAQPQHRKASQPSQTLPQVPLKDSASTVPPRKNSQVSSDSDSEDDAPLAKLIGPRRPGSAMSSYSNLHSRSTGNVTTRSNTHAPPKPLIDINELTTPKRSYTAPEKNAPGFTEGPTLLSLGKMPIAYSQPLVESPVSTSGWRPNMDDNLPLTRKDPPVKFVSPPESPANELDQFVSKKDLQTVRGRTNMSAVSRTPETSPEQRRVPITDRLTKVIQSNLAPPTASASATSSSSNPAPKMTPLRNANHSSEDEDDDEEDGESDAPQAKQKVEQIQTPFPRRSHAPLAMPNARTPNTPTEAEHSPVDQELAQLLGSVAQFISRNGEPSEDSTDSESDDEDNEAADEPTSKDRIAPIPIKERSPPPAFSVTSRPPLYRPNNTTNSSTSNGTASSENTSSRPRSSTLITESSSANTYAPRKSFTSDAIVTQSSPTQLRSERGSPSGAPSVRQRSSTMLTGVPLSSQMPKAFRVPEKPFAGRRNSPASSTGDSSSGRAPLTPRDGSDIVAQEEPSRPKGHVKRRSVSFEDDVQQELKPPSRSYLKEGSKSGSDAGDTSNDEDRLEYKRRERRRTEAKAAIELGNVINGRGPVVDDDEDDMPINQTMNARMSTLNPMMAMGNPMAMQMGFGGSPNSGAWGNNMGQSMLSPAQFMIPPPADPNFLAAHQQAMMIAKQAYQMAVAQQAMAAAADEWERGSTVGGLGGGSIYGGGSVYGGGGGSVYGGGGGSIYGGSAAPPMMSPQFNMMNMMQGGGWPASASVYGGARSMYGGSIGPGDGISGSRSEYGGASGRNGGGNWSSSRSSYGDFSSPSAEQGRNGQQGTRRTANQPRDSGYFPPVPPLPASQNVNGRSSPDMRANPRSRTASQPAHPSRGMPPRKAPPPSSWKAGS